MPETPATYTYRSGERVELVKEPDRFIVRASPRELDAIGMPDAEVVSPRSSRVTTLPDDLEPMMSRARAVAPTHHAYQVAENGQEFLITDRVIVGFVRPPTPDDLDALTGRYALELVETYSEREFLFRLTDHTGMNPVKLVVQLTEHEPLVATADNDLNMRATKAELRVPGDPEYVRQWHLHTRLTDPLFDPRSSAQCEPAWQLLGGYGSADVVIGVTDDGCKLDHDDFNGPGKFVGWGYFAGSQLVRNIDIGADPTRMYESGADHGTSCAGVIAAEVDAALTVGGAPGCRLLPIKWESDGPYLMISDSKLMSALDFVSDRVDVLSNSWGIVPVNLHATAVVNRLRTLAQTGGRRGKGIVFLWAAGNENCPIEHQATIDVPYDSGWTARPDGSAVWTGVTTTRRFRNNLVGVDGVIHVAALASFAQRSHYSNYGTGVGICAPSSGSHKYRRLQSARGIGITTTEGPGDDVTRTFGGTSSATPLVAAVAGLVLSADPSLSAREVIGLLKSTAAKDLDTTPYPRTPPASYDPVPSWDVSPVAPFDRGDFRASDGPDGTWSPWFGHGRVDARAAVAAALRRQPEPQGVLHFEAMPARMIPDADPAGISDMITVSQAGLVQRAEVTIDIHHTWIGDLEIALVAPNGARIVLHDRGGAGQDHILRTFTLATTPSLAVLNGTSIAGDWQLAVRDLERQDQGILKSWALDIVATSAPLIVEDIAAARIPDSAAAGLTRSLSLEPLAAIRELAVAVDISHPYIGDLIVRLLPPGHTPIILHDRTGGSRDHIRRTWRSQTDAELAPLRGSAISGEWRLHVADVARQDVGKLNRWRMEVSVS